MQTEAVPPPIHFTMADFMDERRHAALLSQYDKCSLNAVSEPLVDEPQGSGSVYRLPGVVVSSSEGTPTRSRLLADPSKADDDVAFAVVDCAGRFEIEHCGRSYGMARGQAALHRCDEPLYAANYANCRGFCIKIPRDSILPMVEGGEGAINRQVDPRSPALWMLRSYLPTATHEATLSSPETAKLAATHLRDLVVLALGSSGPGAKVARGGGLKAARLAALKAWIDANLTEPNLTLDHAEILFGLGRRSIQGLFEQTGIGFAVYVREQRLQQVHDWLSDTEKAHLSISELAYDVGFGDLSYFNRCFRQRFGMTPGDVRKGMRPSRH